MKHPYKKILSKHSCISAFFLFLSTLFVILGGWQITKEVLHYKKAQLLAKTGQLQMADSGYSLLQNDNQNQAAQDTPWTQTLLSEETTAQVLACWKAAGSLISHEPTKGQLNMEQAIEMGNSWIKDLANQGILPSVLTQNTYQHISAILYKPEIKTEISDDMLSCWQIKYTQEDIHMNLTLHAASGQVWKAELTASNSQMPAYLDEPLLEAAFSFVSNCGREFIKTTSKNGYNEIRKYSLDEKLYASVSRSPVPSKKQTSYITLALHSKS